MTVPMSTASLLLPPRAHPADVTSVTCNHMYPVLSTAPWRVESLLSQPVSPCKSTISHEAGRTTANHSYPTLVRGRLG